MSWLVRREKQPTSAKCPFRAAAILPCLVDSECLSSRRSVWPP